VAVIREPVKCPVCQGADGAGCRELEGSNGARRFDCDVCGTFEVTEEAWEDFVALASSTLSPIQRAALSHRLRSYSTLNRAVPKLTTEYINQAAMAGFNLPTPAIQAANIIRYIGDEVSKTGNAVQSFPLCFHALVGSPNLDFAFIIMGELEQKGLLTGRPGGTFGVPNELTHVVLTLDGWERYEAERRGLVAGKYGFMAMKFGNVELDGFYKSVIKTAVEKIGYELIRLDEVSKAGIIDNLMRMQIRDSAFVIADLTHDNWGAYWEAGYAEGLGKPVLYVCEQAKFDEKKTHFDTNHCTTVLWSTNEPHQFERELIATLRRSLGLFS
jgi:hypothetical protein